MNSCQNRTKRKTAARAGIKEYVILYGILDRRNDSSVFDMAPPALIDDREKTLRAMNYEAYEKQPVAPGLSQRIVSMVGGKEEKTPLPRTFN